MDSTKTQFLQIIGDYIAGRETNTGDLDEELRLYANRHQLSPIIYFQTKNPSLLPSYIHAVSTYVNRNRVREDLLGELKLNGITAFQIKGNIVASYYPQPALRTSGDCDIVVSDLKTTHDIMIKNGFECISKLEGREWQYMKNGFEFEIHDRLVFDEAINEEKITGFLNNFWPYVKDGALDINFHFIYLLAHLRKHFMNSGVGFRQFLDVAIMKKNCPELDWIWIQQKLDEIGLLAFTQTAFTFIERWWGVSSPIEKVSISDDFFESATNRIFKNGVFGFDNSENTNYLAANEARVGSRIGIALEFLFPSYHGMCASDNYAFLRGKPALLPVAWVYRFFRSVKRGNVNKNAKTAAGKFVSKEYMEQREEMFRQWGLAD